MSRKPSMRARKREVLREIARLTEMAQQGLAELDQLRQPPAGDNTMGAKGGIVIEGHIIGDTIVTDVD
jgi:hypothetical protein